MEKRNEHRIPFDKPLHNGYAVTDFILEINAEQGLSASVVDISLDGAGFTITNADKALAETIPTMKTMFATLHIKDIAILTESRLVWCNTKQNNEHMTIQGGVQFTVIAPKDRIALHTILTSIRSDMRG
jgi:c-di-GMP-binding flagellar brake protein YcgR